MRIALGLLLPLSLFGVTFDALLEHAKTHAPELHALRTQEQIARIDLKTALLFDNPALSWSINDIWLDDPLNRSIEPMQTSLYSITQNLPFFGKREAKKNIAHAALQERTAQTRQIWQNLSLALTTQAIETWKNAQLSTLYRRYIQIEQQTIALFEAYAATQNHFHADIVTAELALSSLHIALLSYETGYTQALKTLSYLSGMEVLALEFTPGPWALPSMESFESRFHDAPMLLPFNAMVKKRAFARTLAQKETIPDLSVTLGYAHRARYEDYISIGVGVKIPVYGKETALHERSQLEYLQAAQEHTYIQSKLRNELHTLYAALKYQYDAYEILTNQSLPHISHLFDVAGARIKTGGDLVKYLDILDKKRETETKLIEMQASFYHTKARLEALVGGL